MYFFARLYDSRFEGRLAHAQRQQQLLEKSSLEPSLYHDYPPFKKSRLMQAPTGPLNLHIGNNSSSNGTDPRGQGEERRDHLYLRAKTLEELNYSNQGGGAQSATSPGGYNYPSQYPSQYYQHNQAKYQAAREHHQRFYEQSHPELSHAQQSTAALMAVSQASGMGKEGGGPTLAPRQLNPRLQHPTSQYPGGISGSSDPYMMYRGAGGFHPSFDPRLMGRGGPPVSAEHRQHVGKYLYDRAAAGISHPGYNMPPKVQNKFFTLTSSSFKYLFTFTYLILE